jgi:hypothetical protein
MLDGNQAIILRHIKHPKTYAKHPGVTATRTPWWWPCGGIDSRSLINIDPDYCLLLSRYGREMPSTL